MVTLSERTGIAFSAVQSRIAQNPQVYAGVLAGARFLEQTPVPPNQFPDSEEVAALWPYCCGGIFLLGGVYTLISLIAGARRRTQFEAVQPEPVEPRDN